MSGAVRHDLWQYLVGGQMEIGRVYFFKVDCQTSRPAFEAPFPPPSISDNIEIGVSFEYEFITDPDAGQGSFVHVFTNTNAVPITVSTDLNLDGGPTWTWFALLGFYEGVSEADVRAAVNASPTGLPGVINGVGYDGRSWIFNNLEAFHYSGVTIVTFSADGRIASEAASLFDEVTTTFFDPPV